MAPRTSDHPDDQKLLASHLRALREKAGLSQRALADILGVSQAWVYHREMLHTQFTFLDFLHWCKACGAEADPTFRRINRELGIR